MEACEDFIIPAPYPLLKEDSEAINEASPVDPDGDDWAKPCLDAFKKRIRKYLLKKQKYRCAYCRMELHDNEATPEIEHIVPKNLKPKWMYEPFNLCISCKLCNTKKGHTKPVLVNDKIDILPTNSEAYQLIHPHLDRYSENIEIVDGILYKGIGEKGVHTIWLCELDRYELAAARASIILQHDLGNYTRFLMLVQDTENQKLLNNLDGFLESIKDKIDLYKEKNAAEAESMEND